MNKSLKTLISIVLGIIVLWGIIFAIDYFRCANLKTPIFVVAKETADDGGSGIYYGLGYKVKVEKNISAEYGVYLEKIEMYMFDKVIIGAIANINVLYDTPTVTKIEELPENYNVLQAAKDNCIVSTNDRKIFNKDKFDEFIENVKNNKPDFIRGIVFTTEGDMIITDVNFEGNNSFSVCKDFTRDKYLSSKDRTYKYGKFSKITIDETQERIDIYLEDAIEGDMKSIHIVGYGKDYTIINDYKNDYLLKVIPHEKEEAQIITTGELEAKYEYDIYYSGVENVTIKINNEEIDLKQALLNNNITMEQIIEQAEKDRENEIIFTDMLKDGGTMFYYYHTYIIKKCNSLDGNRDVYIIYR